MPEFSNNLRKKRKFTCIKFMTCFLISHLVKIKYRYILKLLKNNLIITITF